MVAKIAHGTSLIGAIAYNKLKVDDERGKVLFSQNIREPSNKNYEMHDILRSFDPYLAANRRTEKPIIHISLNPDTKDNKIKQEYKS